MSNQAPEQASQAQLKRPGLNVRVVIILVVLAVIVGGGGYLFVRYEQHQAALSANVTGTWAITRSSGNGSGMMTVAQNGSQLSGTLTGNRRLDTSDGIGLSGKISDGVITLDGTGSFDFTGVTFQVTEHFDGTLSDATHMSGTETVTIDTPPAQSNSWSAEKTG